MFLRAENGCDEDSAIANVFPGWLGNLLPKYETKARA
jgi:hypothetical protein